MKTRFGSNLAVVQKTMTVGGIRLTDQQFLAEVEAEIRKALEPDGWVVEGYVSEPVRPLLSIALSHRLSPSGLVISAEPMMLRSLCHSEIRASPEVQLIHRARNVVGERNADLLRRMREAAAWPRAGDARDAMVSAGWALVDHHVLTQPEMAWLADALENSNGSPYEMGRD